MMDLIITILLVVTKDLPISPRFTPYNRYVYESMVITYSRCMDQPGKVANPARGQLNREN